MKIIASLILIAVLYSCEKKSNSTNTSCASTQCKETAASTGQRCQNMTTNCAGLCHVHD